jgi:hypothetical protein
MTHVAYYWVFVGVLVLVIFFVSLREALSLLSLPKGHPDRGGCWFNSLFLLLFAGAVLSGATYLDLHRVLLEQLLSPYPQARYAYERNGVAHGTTWVYVTKDTKDAVRNFYYREAKEKHFSIIADDSSPERISLVLPSGMLFLTIKQEGGKIVLYYSRDGKVLGVTAQ